jgi:hypothetical protein
MSRARYRAVTALLVPLALATTACGMKPYQNPDHREEGPSHGLLTGSDGEWVLYRKGQSAPPAGAKSAATDRSDSAPALPEAPPGLK